MPTNSTPLKSTLPLPIRPLIPRLTRLLLPQQIFVIHHPRSAYTVLLFILADDAPGPCLNPEATVQRMHALYPQVHISLHKTSVMRHCLLVGHPYYSRVCIAARQVYSSGAAALPVTSDKALAAADAHTTLQFHINKTVAHGFLQCARHCIAGKNYILALFMLHQCAALTLRGVIAAFTRQEVQWHQLPQLLHYTHRFAPALQQVFSTGNATHTRLLQLLNSAYTEARYNASFTVSAADAKLLLKKVERLGQLALRLFH